MKTWKLLLFIVILSLIIYIPIQLIYANNYHFLTLQNLFIFPILMLFFYFLSKQLDKQKQEQIEKSIKYSKEELLAEEWLRKEYAPGVLSRFKQHSIKIILYGSLFFFFFYFIWLMFLHIEYRELQLVFFYVIPLTFICLATYLYFIFSHYDSFAATLSERMSKHKKLRWLTFINSDHMKLYLILIPCVLISSDIYALSVKTHISLLFNLLYFTIAYIILCSITKIIRS